MFDTKKKKSSKKSEQGDLKYLGGLLLAKMAFGGAARLRSNADEVNKLNVFPVPDGDTGDNMRMTVESGIAAIENLDSDDLSEVMKVLSHGMLLGARGNSGVILSQFFSGISKGLVGTQKADPAILGHALELGRTAGLHLRYDAHRGHHSDGSARGGGICGEAHHPPEHPAQFLC